MMAINKTLLSSGCYRMPWSKVVRCWLGAIHKQAQLNTIAQAPSQFYLKTAKRVFATRHAGWGTTHALTAFHISTAQHAKRHGQPAFLYPARFIQVVNDFRFPAGVRKLVVHAPGGIGVGGMDDDRTERRQAG